MDIKQLLRPCIKSLKPYSSARDEYKGEASIFLDANENPFTPEYNRYPDPLQWPVKEAVALLKGVEPEQIFLGNGSDEPIDLLYRAFCEPRQDNVVAIDPTYGMYRVCADVNDVAYRPVRLSSEYEVSADELLKACDSSTKIIWLCSPNNPTSNSLDHKIIESLLKRFQGIVVVDEAYIDFSSSSSWLLRLAEYPNLVVLQTFSKAWGSAAIRLGMAFAAKELVAVLNKIKYPYNINQLTQEYALRMLENAEQVKVWVSDILSEREWMARELASLSGVVKVYPSDANFILAKVTDANEAYARLVEQGIIVRNRNKISLCDNCLRITIGTPEENRLFIQALRAILSNITV